MAAGRAGHGQDTDAVALLERFGTQMRATARRYSATTHDAEDAFQRASEILVRRRPGGAEDDLCRWLRTTVKHEALAIRERESRLVPAGAADRIELPQPNPEDTEERARRYERLRLAARALRRCKPQEISCLVLRAEGFSYAEISERTSFSYTKVNRCLTEGRAGFARELAKLEAEGAPGPRALPLGRPEADRPAAAALAA